MILIFSANFHAQKIAVLAPEKNQPTRSFIEKLEAAFPASVKILDGDLSDAAYRSQNFDKPFNLTLSEAKNVGAAIGSDYFLLVKAENLRRMSSARGEFYESYGLVFVVSARTGRLVFWRAESRSSKTLNDAQTNLFAAVNFLTAEISERLKKITTEELNEKPSADFQPPPEENSPDAEDFKPPLPYKRLSPIYTRLANLYAVEATVDVEADVDETGKILNTSIVRWAGFGLDESVAENVRRMNWRAASKNGKATSVRVLLRYNFKKIKPADD